LPTDVHSGKYAFWSNKGNESDMTLTREFDFTGVSGPIEISYWTWYDIEEDWDYLYPRSLHRWRKWEILKTPSGTDTTRPAIRTAGATPAGPAAGSRKPSTSRSLPGRSVFIRFEYVTDAAVNGEGLLLDDVRIDAINYQSDFEADDGGWARKASRVSTTSSRRPIA
jgi:immune inhibitor A